MTTEILSISEILSSQASKEVTHNTALRELEGQLIHVKDKDLATPPGSPAEGDTYIVASSPTGAWVGHTGDIAHYYGAAWHFHTKREGLCLWVDDENLLYAYDGSAWASILAGLGSGTVTTVSVVSANGFSGSVANATTTPAITLSFTADVMIFRGVIDCSTNPNYPAADAGAVYKISIAGKIGGASGPNVEAGDTVYCITDGTSSGTQAAVGANWVIEQSNVDGAYFAGGTDVAVADGGTGASTASGARTNLGLVIGTDIQAHSAALDAVSGTNTGDQTSVTGNAGTATALATGRTIDGQTFDGTANITVIAPGTHAATSKATPVDADELPLVDSAASNVLKKLTWANLKATAKAYFDTLYQVLDSDLTTIAGLTATTDNFIQSKSSAWASRTVAQVTTDLQATGLIDGAVGFRQIPQNSQSAAYTTVAADSGKHILHPSADTSARTWTIDSNANVAYPIGTAITFINQHSGGVITIVITSDTMRLAGSGSTGSRTLAADNVATAIKITSTEWIISGSSGLT